MENKTGKAALLIVISLIILLMIPSVLSICCEKNEPCTISETCQDGDCGNATITIYNGTGIVINPQTTMNEINSFLYTFNASENNFTSYGIYPYAINTTTSKFCQGDCYVEVKAECFATPDEYYLYIVGIILFFGLFGLGYFLEDTTFTIISGMLLVVIAIALYQIGFSKLDNEFLKQAIIMVTAGIGFYLIIVPSVDWFENFKGSFGGKMP